VRTFFAGGSRPSRYVASPFGFSEAGRGAQLLIAHLDGQEVDAGMRVNLQLEAFVVLSGGFVAGSLAELLEHLAELRGA
jgi:hypothetical protein